MTKIKICGIKNLETVNTLNVHLPDYIGFIFAKSIRNVTMIEAKKIKDNLNPKIKTVGVFVNEKIDKVLEIVKNVDIDVLQLHGDEDNDYIKKIKDKTDKEIWKAIRVKDSVDFSNYNTDKILLDTYKKGTYGGVGEKFNWNVIEKEKYKNIILAGGINIENVKEALKLSPYMIDINSGVETNGEKDDKKIIEIIKLIRGD